MMLKRSLLPLLSLLSLAASVGDQVRHLMINDSNLIETMQGFAMNSPNLLSNNIKTVSVNGNNVVVTQPNCQETNMNKQQLATEMPQILNLLSSTKMQLNSAESNQPVQMMSQQQQTGPIRSGLARFSLNDQAMATMSYGRNMNFQSFSSNGWAMTKYDEDNVSLKRPNMPNNINRIFLSEDVVTFVYNNGMVQMKPAVCLQPAEQQLVQQVRAEIQQAQGHFQQNMRQFNSNMQNMQQNMQQNMHNMQMQMQQNMRNMNQNLQGMFGHQQQQLFNNPMYNGQQMMQNGAYAAAGAGVPYGQASTFANTATSPFGTNFPFGPNNSPFGQGFPFGR